MKQRAEIIFETEETIVLREGSKIIAAYCTNCDETVLMATPRTIAALSDSTEREIFRLIENGLLHFMENDGIYICLNSFTVIKGD